MYQTTVATDAVSHTALDFPGVSIQILHQEAGGGMAVLTTMAPGAEI